MATGSRGTEPEEEDVCCGSIDGARDFCPLPREQRSESEHYLSGPIIVCREHRLADAIGESRCSGRDDPHEQLSARIHRWDLNMCTKSGSICPPICLLVTAGNFLRPAISPYATGRVCFEICCLRFDPSSFPNRAICKSKTILSGHDWKH